MIRFLKGIVIGLASLFIGATILGIAGIIVYVFYNFIKGLLSH
ncbi:MAG: hypothetical protein ACLQQ4_04150 [Bacteroidia bacterium]